jgi:DNA-binding transcriptional LysR family regulator
MRWSSQVRRRLKLRDLDTLVAVARHGSMAKASTTLSVTQPAVSKAIASLEETLGVPLLDRTTHGVEPNLYGRALLKWAIAIFDDAKQGVDEIEFLTSPGAGEVRIAAGPQIIAGILPVVLSSLRRDFPRISFHVSQSGDSHQQYQALRERSVDLVVGRILGLDNFVDEIHTEIIFDDAWFVVCGIQNPLARRRKITLGALAREPWTLPPYANVAGSFAAQLFRAAGGDPPATAVTCGTVEMQTALLAQGPYLAFYPRSVLIFGAARASVKTLPVELPLQPPPVGILTWRNRTLSPVVQLFMDRLRAVAKPLVQSQAR